jgi:hypothetical protein
LASKEVDFYRNMSGYEKKRFFSDVSKVTIENRDGKTQNRPLLGYCSEVSDER